MFCSSYLIAQTLAALFGGAGIVALLPSAKEGTASKLQTFFAVFTLVLVSYFALCALYHFDYDQAGSFQFAERVGWIPSIGVFYAVGADGLSLALWALTVFVADVVFAWTIFSTRAKTSMFASMLMLVGAVFGCFVAKDLVLFFAFFELMLPPSYVLMIAFGAGTHSNGVDNEAPLSLNPAFATTELTGNKPERAAFIFVLYTALAGAFLLAGIIGIGALQAATGEVSFGFDELSVTAARAPVWIVATFAIAFGIKAALVPLHGWVVTTYEKAPIQATILFAALLSKVGLYGFFRVCHGIFSETFVFIQGYVLVLGIVGILYGALLAIVQPTVRRMLAYSSISHLGFCFAGLGANNSASLVGAAFQMINHGITVTSLFIVVWALEQRSVNLRFDKVRGLGARLPWIAGYFAVFMLSSVALPLTNNFVGEFLILSGLASVHVIAALAATVGVVLVAIYMLQAVQNLFHGKISELQSGGIADLGWTEKIMLVPLVVAIFTLGIRPQPVLHMLTASLVESPSKPLFTEVEDSPGIPVNGSSIGVESGNADAEAVDGGAEKSQIAPSIEASPTHANTLGTEGTL